MLKATVVPETSLLVVLGCGLRSDFSFVLGWVVSVRWWVGSGWVEENKQTHNPDVSVY